MLRTSTEVFSLGRALIWRLTIIAPLVTLAAATDPGRAEDQAQREQTIRVTPDQDLVAALQAAPDGATIALSSGRFNGPLVIQGKTLTIQGQAQGGTVVFTDRSNAVLLATEGASASVDNVVLEGGQAKQLGAYVKQATLRLSASAIRNTLTDAVYVEAGKLELSKVDISNVKGNGIAAVNGASVEIAESVLYGVEGIGVVLSEGVRLSVRNSTIGGAQAVVVDGGAPETILEDVALHSSAPDRAGLYVKSTGSVVVADSRIAAEGSAIYLTAGNDAPVSLTNNLIYALGPAARGAIAAEMSGAPDKGPVITGNRILVGAAGEGAYGILLRGAMSASLGNNRVVVRGGVGIALENGAHAQLSGNAVVADAGTVSFIKTDDAATRLESEILLPVGDIRGSPTLGEDTAALRAQLGDPALASELKAQRDGAIEFALTGRPDPQQSVQRYFDELDQRLKVFAQALGAMGRVALLVVDGSGQDVRVPFTLLDRDGKVIARTDWNAPTAKLAAGDYLLVPDFDPLEQIEVKVTAGEAREVRLDEPQALWLRFVVWKSDKREERRHLIRLRPPAERQAAIARLRLPGFFETVADRRASATAEDMTAALDLARAWLQGGKEQKYPDRGPDDVFGWIRWRHADLVAYRIMALAGTADDVGWLSGVSAKSTSFDAPIERLEGAALIEARLGRLESGHFAELAKKGEGPGAALAALVLHEHGIRDYDNVAINTILSETRPTMLQQYGYRFVVTMLDRGDERVVAAIRSLWEHYRKRATELAALSEEQRKGQYNEYGSIGWLTALYLLAYGTPEDWRQVAEEPLESYSVGPLAGLAADLRQMSQILAEIGDNITISSYVGHVAVSRPDDLPSVHQEMSAHAYQIGYARAVESGEYNPQQKGLNQISTYEAYTAPFWPNEGMATLYYGEANGLGGDPSLTWVPYAWSHDEIVDRVLAGTASELDQAQLDHMPHDRLVQMFAKKNAATLLPNAALVLAYHKIATRAHRVFDATQTGQSFSENGDEWRAFVFSARGTGADFEGAISGRLDVEPYFVGTELKLRLRLLPAQHYKPGGFIEFGSTNLDQHRNYLAKPRTLIAGVRLRRGETIIPVREEESADKGAYVFSADLVGRDVSDLWADVELAYFDKHVELPIPLYFGPVARTQRLLRAAVEAAKAQLAAAPGDVTALTSLARAQRDYGDVDAAWASYAVALEREPERSELWYEAADMFTAANLRTRAIEIFEQALARQPGDLDLTYSLGAQAYAAADYARAVRAFGAVVAAAPDDADARMWHANASFMVRDWAAADQAYGALPADMQSAWVMMRRLIAVTEAGGGSLTDFSGFDAARAAMTDPTMQACDQDFYGAYRLKFSGQQDNARASFERARSSCPHDSFERRAVVAAVQ